MGRTGLEVSFTNRFTVIKHFYCPTNQKKMTTKIKMQEIHLIFQGSLFITHFCYQLLLTVYVLDSVVNEL